MARERSTPYPTQLKRLLANEKKLDVFSAATLEDRLDHPQHQKRQSRISGIHKALRNAFASGEIVAFLDDEGRPLRETKILVPGSKAISQPQIFGRPGVASPDPRFRATTYEELTRRGFAMDGESPGQDPDRREVETDEDSDSNCDPTGPTGEEAPPEGGPQDQPVDEGSPLSPAQARERVNVYPPNGSTAPNWIDDRILRVWASLPEVSKVLVRGLDVAVGVDKLELIRAGVTRKQPSWRSESNVAGNLASLARKSSGVWINIAGPAIAHYTAEPDGLKPADLSELAANPLDFYERADSPPDGVLLCAMALKADEAVLELIGSDTANELGEIKSRSQTTALEDSNAALKSEAAEFRRAAKAAEKEVKSLQRERGALSDENRRLRAAQQEAGEAAATAQAEADQALVSRAEEAEASLEKLEADRIPELEARLEGLEDVQERLERAEGELYDERRLAKQATEDVKRLNLRVRELSDQLSSAEGSRNLPVEDATALIDALAGPVGQAARHAAERLSTNNQQSHDELLLELAGVVARMSGRLDADEERLAGGDAKTPTEIRPGDDRGQARDSESEAAASSPQTTPGLSTDTARSPEPLTPAVAEQGSEAAASPTPQARLRRRSRFKVRPLGGAGEVGGSAFLVTNSAGHTLLLDCGQRVRGEYGLDTEPQFHRRISHQGRLHGILLSHAHIDHVGSLPVLHREQSDTQAEPIPIYLTEPTRRLTQIMLEDSAKIQQGRELNAAESGFLDYGAGSMEAAYRLPDVKRVLDDEFIREVPPGLAIPVPDTSFVVRFLPVAHVLGSCAIHLTDTDNDQTLLYSGDLGPIGDPQATLPQYAVREMLSADLVIVESTYGARQPDATDAQGRRRSLSPRNAAIKRLCSLASHAHDRNGCLLLPAFSLGRTQELAMLIDRARREGEAPPGEIKVAGMGEKITQVYSDYSKGSNAWARAQDMPRVEELGKLMRTSALEFDDVVAEVLEGGFTYIIASPAMLASGWSRSFLENMVDNPSHAVAMSGFLPRNAGGIPGLHRMHTGATMDIGGRNHRVQAQFEQLKGLSAHAPSVDLHKFAEYLVRQGNGVNFAMVHGEQAAQEAFAADVAAFPDVGSAESLHNGQVWQPQRP